MSIYENIRFGKVDATRAEIEEAAQQANAHNFIMELPKVCVRYSSSCTDVYFYLTFRNMKHLLVNKVSN
jgi:ABC-type multidrug transport system fused ATPase/permease subunit